MFHGIVCIKQVPDITEVQLDSATNTLARAHVPSIINPFDRYALEEALRHRDTLGGTVTVLTMGPPQAMDALRQACAMGADRAILLSDPRLAGSDTWATAYALAHAIRKLAPFDVIFCGRQAIDGDTAQVGPSLARQLGIPALTYCCSVKALDLPAHSITVVRLLTDSREVVQAPLPALLTVLKDINEPRYPSLLGKRRAARIEIPIWDIGQLGLDAAQVGLDGSPTRVYRTQTAAPPNRALTLIDGDSPQDIAAQLWPLLSQLTRNEPLP